MSKGLLGAIVGVVGFIAGVVGLLIDWPRLYDWYKDGAIKPGSPEVMFLYGRWCSDDGSIQEIKRSGADAILTACLPKHFGDCAEAFLTSREELPVNRIRFGWAEGDVRFTVEGTTAPIRVKHDAPDAIRQILAGEVQGQAYMRCSG